MAAGGQFAAKYRSLFCVVMTLVRCRGVGKCLILVSCLSVLERRLSRVLEEGGDWTEIFEDFFICFCAGSALWSEVFISFVVVGFGNGISSI